MAKTKEIMSQLTEGLAQGKQSGRNLVTLIEVKSNHLSVAV
jgi:hypothetical protein